MKVFKVDTSKVKADSIKGGPQDGLVVYELHAHTREGCNVRFKVNEDEAEQLFWALLNRLSEQGHKRVAEVMKALRKQ